MSKISTSPVQRELLAAFRDRPFPLPSKYTRAFPALVRKGLIVPSMEAGNFQGYILTKFGRETIKRMRTK
jgi:hypothetical protein